MTDYNQVRIFDTDIPCWEKEYKLPSLTESFIHNNYNTIAIQFALATLFSCTFPLAPLFILLINIWDIRNKARKVLLGYRRPLLLNASGPSIWHNLIFITAHVVPLFNVAVIVFQSRLFRRKLSDQYYARLRMIHGQYEWRFGRLNVDYFEQFQEYAEQYKTVKEQFYKYWHFNIGNCITFDNWIDVNSKNLHEPILEWWHIRSFGIEFMLFCEAGLLLMSLIMHFLLPSNSNDIHDTMMMEKRIKQKFYIRKGFAV